MRHALLFLACLLILIGCASRRATTATPIQTGDGTQRFFLDCGRQGMARCIAKANEMCPQGYNIDGQDGRTGVEVGRFGGGTYTQSTMRITCK